MDTEWISNEINAVAEGMKKLSACAPRIREIAEACTAALKTGRKVMFCGNGGSAADSQHLAAELIGRYKLERPAMRAIALTTDTSILTAIGNDYGYDDVFRRQVEGLGRRGCAHRPFHQRQQPQRAARLRAGQGHGYHHRGSHGAGGSAMGEAADITLAVPATVTNHIQEMHITCGHLICELVELELHG